MRVIKAYDVESAKASVTLNARHLDRINFIAVRWRICPRVAATYCRRHDAGVVLELAQQRSAALVRVRFLTVAANLTIIGLAEFQHAPPLFYHAATAFSS